MRPLLSVVNVGLVAVTALCVSGAQASTRQVPTDGMVLRYGPEVSSVAALRRVGTSSQALDNSRRVPGYM